MLTLFDAMKIFTKIILDNNNNVIEEDYYNYFGPISYCGIHYDFKSTRGAKAMEKKAKREKKLADKRAKKQAKAGKKNEAVNKMHDVKKPITLEDLTNPNKSK